MVSGRGRGGVLDYSFFQFLVSAEASTRSGLVKTSEFLEASFKVSILAQQVSPSYRPTTIGRRLKTSEFLEASLKVSILAQQVAAILPSYYHRSSPDNQ